MPPDWRATPQPAGLDATDAAPSQPPRTGPEEGLLRRLTRERLLAREQAAGATEAPVIPWGVIGPIG